ncbi:uncharacterized protein LOC132266786 isoform X2 [Cornus florida]|uniref:uncharacterized protein LOC132266786 isoform X2 n=1 Tax=Cornus florida TaxID=4283 RepID=UPI0028967E50|nr:uncharacterized protein LOC132266786 isoform X2 [Cornus florida]
MPGVELTSRLECSKSFPDRQELEEDSSDHSIEASRHLKLDTGHLNDCVNTKKNESPNAEVQSALRQEILQLEKRLQDQVGVRHALEKALGFRSSSHDITDEISMPKPTTELIKEIAVLELEVVHLEQYLLSLYRKTFDQQVSSITPCTKDERSKSPLNTTRGRHLEVSNSDVTLKRENSTVNASYQSLSNSWNKYNNIGAEKNLLDSFAHRCHSSLAQSSALATRSSPAEPLGKAVRACHSQPASMMEYAQNASANVVSLAEHLGARVADHVPETPNKLSEDMIKCMSAIYCKLADPPLTNHGLSSPTSSSSPLSTISPKEHCDMWSPGFMKSFDVRLDNPFHVEGLKEYSGPYSAMVEVPCIYRDNKRLGDIEQMLQNFRSLICRLEEVDPRKMKHEEKLAFWINVHNALVMHAFLAYGIPQNNVKRVFLLLKAAYDVGGHIISANMIRSSVLGCRISHLGKWLRLLLSSKTKLKTGDEQQAYAIDHQEPLLYFALCSGSHSDPAVRVYTPKRVFQELEAAKEEYIRATFGIRNNQKILLPKIVESFAKDSDLCPTGLMEMIEQCLPESTKKCIKKCRLGKSRKIIEWTPHNFAFRYLISKELMQ